MLLLYAATLFLSAFLLFLIQPMVGKMILPALGGTPAVWNTCMVFFQAALLAGYSVAHGSIRALGARRQSLLHVALLALPLLPILHLLPLRIGLQHVPTSADNPALWLLGRLALGVGLPFLVVATNAPVLQMWFSQTGHHSSRDPYFLYGASNLGSLLALLGYPLVVERFTSLKQQAVLWSWGYGALLFFVLLCAVTLRWSRPPHVDLPRGEGDDVSAEERVTTGRRLHWVALAFVPSSLTLGATSYITTDLAPIPLLWVLPLALYILSFVIVFARKPMIPHEKALLAFPFVLAPVALLPTENIAVLGLVPVGAHLLLLFAVAIVCHGELVKDRPHIGHLTQFYLCMSIGGVLGGIFNGLISPSVFRTLVEYPLVMVLACLVLAGRHEYRAARTLQNLGIAALVFGIVLPLRWYIEYHKHHEHALLITVGIPALVCIGVYKLWRRWMGFGLAVGASLLAVSYCSRFGPERVLYRSRNYYGVKSVAMDNVRDAHYFYNGTTLHGVQLLGGAESRTPLSYYHSAGPVGDVMRDFHSQHRAIRAGVVGLGAGTLGVYRERGDSFLFYEIDPEVKRIATDSAFFTYLANCGEGCNVVLGDGRLAMATAPDHGYNMIFLDAFSSDAIPTHLLTKEAVQLYLQKLSKDGIMVFHITNRYLHLEQMLGNLADELGLACAQRDDRRIDPTDIRSSGRSSSYYLVMATEEEHLTGLRHLGWVDPPKDSSAGVWSDDQTSIWNVLDW